MPWRRPSVAIEPSDLNAYGFTRPRRLRDEPAGLAQRVLAGRRVELAGRLVGHGGDVAEREHAVQTRRRGRARPPARGRARRAAARAARRRGWRRRRPSRRRCSVSIRRPSDSTAPPRSMDASAVEERISTPRPDSVRAANRARLSGTCPRMRGPESTKTQRGRTPAKRGCRRSAPSVSSWSSATASTPAKPAPAKTNVSRRSALAGSASASSSWRSTWLRRRIASPMSLRPSACSRRPGTSGVLVIEPSATTSRS